MTRTRFWSLTGTNSYREVAELQKALVELRVRDEIPDTVLFVEHEPVVTRGRGLQRGGGHEQRHMPAPVLPAGIALEESERGGDLTFHGPGQLVIYPICKLDGNGIAPNRDVEGFIRLLEELLIEEFNAFGLIGNSRPGASGVWVGKKKVASVGIAVRKWVSYHGIAVNLTNDLKPFAYFSPCGFDPEVMARLSDLVKISGLDSPGAWRKSMENRLAERMAEMESLPGPVHAYEVERIPLETAMARTLAGTPGMVADAGSSASDRSAAEEVPGGY